MLVVEKLLSARKDVERNLDGNCKRKVGKQLITRLHSFIQVSMAKGPQPSSPPLTLQRSNYSSPAEQTASGSYAQATQQPPQSGATSGPTFPAANTVVYRKHQPPCFPESEQEQPRLAECDTRWHDDSTDRKGRLPESGHYQNLAIAEEAISVTKQNEASAHSVKESPGIYLVVLRYKTPPFRPFDFDAAIYSRGNQRRIQGGQEGGFDRHNPGQKLRTRLSQTPHKYTSGPRALSPPPHGEDAAPPDLRPTAPGRATTAPSTYFAPREEVSDPFLLQEISMPRGEALPGELLEERFGRVPATTPAYLKGAKQPSSASWF
ncbi:uncharacterized protein CTHT_0021130 [Thermochaetoides thermophila DSM 1495]|uniref:Uncharacterized protein n=1 Tax=Chaetomium thermophilum (strain DSM 1495 / CBS 144.50 / IMI 039719) TaxID=759272 RepID=G0S3I2_CHATD|nr:hypothetical protein CTHT_0021130 [Thermochaetoides thermophila DSM 1495]EGS22565.1 hypothetical protein CTHT_0021130 [Thermochaetoides thermophila DSM 1495]